MAGTAKPCSRESVAYVSVLTFFQNARMQYIKLESNEFLPKKWYFKVYQCHCSHKGIINVMMDWVEISIKIKGVRMQIWAWILRTCFSACANVAKARTIKELRYLLLLSRCLGITTAAVWQWKPLQPDCRYFESRCQLYYSTGEEKTAN